MHKKFKNKQLYKHRYGRCPFCGENSYDLLDVHRWRIPGKDGGKYTADNVIVVCSNCHRKIHQNTIQIENIYNSTKGEIVIYYENNQEKISEL